MTDESSKESQENTSSSSSRVTLQDVACSLLENLTNSEPTSSSISTSPTRINMKDKKRLQVKKACNNCRKNHMGCDSQRPCMRCTMRNLESSCSDNPSANPTPPKSQKKLINNNNNNNLTNNNLNNNNNTNNNKVERGVGGKDSLSSVLCAPSIYHLPQPHLSTPVYPLISLPSIIPTMVGTQFYPIQAGRTTTNPPPKFNSTNFNVNNNNNISNINNNNNTTTTTTTTSPTSSSSPPSISLNTTTSSSGSSLQKNSNSSPIDIPDLLEQRDEVSSLPYHHINNNTNNYNVGTSISHSSIPKTTINNNNNNINSTTTTSTSNPLPNSLNHIINNSSSNNNNNNNSNINNSSNNSNNSMSDDDCKHCKIIPNRDPKLRVEIKYLNDSQSFEVSSKTTYKELLDYATHHWHLNSHTYELRNKNGDVLVGICDKPYGPIYLFPISRPLETAPHVHCHQNGCDISNLAATQ